MSSDLTRDPMSDELAEWGKVILIETRGRRSGRPFVTAVGFVEEPDGALLVSASDDHTHWGLNLIAQQDCRVTREGHTAGYRAQLLHGAERNHAITSLILAYGTPAEQLGAGPAFRLIPMNE